MTGAVKQRGVKIFTAQMARGGAFAEILHAGIGSICDFRFQLKTGRVAVIDGDATRSDALFFELIQDEAAKRIVADAAHPAHLESETRETGGDIQLRPRDAFKKVFYLCQIAGLGRDKHRHRFADGNHIQWLFHVHSSRSRLT